MPPGPPDAALSQALAAERAARENAEQRAAQAEGEAQGLALTVNGLEDEVQRNQEVIKTQAEELGRVRGSLAAAVATGSGGKSGGNGEESDDDAAAMMAENWMLKAELGRAQEDLAAAEEKRKVSTSEVKRKRGRGMKGR